MSFRLVLIKILLIVFPGLALGQESTPPVVSQVVVQALKQGSWQSEGNGFSILRAITQGGLLVTAFRFSPEQYTFEVMTQTRDTGSRARQIGEQSGAVLVVNGGFFAERENGALYPIGYLRVENEVLSKGWPAAGGLAQFGEDGIILSPTHQGIPKDGGDVLQSKPMLIEPGGSWAMGSNLNESKLRTILCRRKNGEILFVLITRVGMSLYEAGWIMREPAEGGFFGCDSALALDGGRSTQVWYSGGKSVSHVGLAPVQNFIVVRQKEN